MKLSDLDPNAYNGAYFILVQDEAASLLIKQKDGKICRLVRGSSSYTTADELSLGSDEILDHLGPDTEVQRVVIEHEDDRRYYNNPICSASFKKLIGRKE